jgi:hypothetical protein
MNSVPQMLAAFAFFGLIFVCPLLYMLMKHQRAMTELIHRGAPDDALRRIHMLEQEVHALKVASYDQILKQDDQQDLARRVHG